MRLGITIHTNPRLDRGVVKVLVRQERGLPPRLFSRTMRVPVGKVDSGETILVGGTVVPWFEDFGPAMFA